MSIQAFGTRRVSESLNAINDYLDQAIRIADAIPPGQIIAATLAPVAGTVSPRLKTVLWQLSSGTTSSAPFDDVKNGATVVVTGVNLSHATAPTTFVNDIKVLK